MTAIEHTLLGNNAAWSIDTDGGDGGNNQSRRVHAQSMGGGHMGTGTRERTAASLCESFAANSAFFADDEK